MNASSSRRPVSVIKILLIACLMLLSALGSWGASVSAGPTTIPMVELGAPASGGSVLGATEAPREIPEVCPVCRTAE